MKGNILGALCKAQYQDLIESSKDHHLAHFHAKRVARKMKIIEPLYRNQIIANKGYRDIVRKVEVSRNALIYGEFFGIF